MAKLYNFGPKPLGKYSLPMPMAKLYNSKTSRVSGTTDHTPLTSLIIIITSTRSIKFPNYNLITYKPIQYANKISQLQFEITQD